MTKDFKALEEELDLWFDEEKEKLSKEYFEILFQMRKTPKNEEDEDSKKDKKIKLPKSRKDVEKDFINKMRLLRKEYRQRYKKIRDEQDRIRERRKKIEKILEPYMKIYTAIHEFFFWIILVRIKRFFSRIKHISNDFKIYLKKILFLLNETYIFKIKRYLDPIIYPFRKNIKKIIRPIHKVIDFISDSYKRFTDKIRAKILNYIDIIIKYYKILVEFYKKISKIISDRIEKQKNNINKMYEKTLGPLVEKIKKMFPEKEDED